MSKRFADVVLDVDPRERVSAAVPIDPVPFRIGLLGAFSGRSAARGSVTAGSGPIEIDRDNFDEVFAGLEPRIQLSLADGGPDLDLRFTEIDDFHPDRLYERVSLFSELRALRRRAAEPASFREVATELGIEAEQPPANAVEPRSGGSGSLLDLIIDEHAPAPSPALGDRAEILDSDFDLGAYVRRITAPYLRAAPDPRQDELLASIDRAITEQMRKVLHHPAFRELEASWRAVFRLTREIETDTLLRIHLVDVSREEIVSDLADGDGTRLPSRLRGTEGSEPWALLAAAYSVGPGEEDLAFSRTLRDAAVTIGAPCVAAALPNLVGCPSFSGDPDPHGWDPVAPAWSDFRREPGADFLGLAFPRFLLRLPYGADSDPCDLFRFEEIEEIPRHEDFLWGNPAFLVALLLAQTYSKMGWGLVPGTIAEVDRLPMYTYREADDVRLQPCAEGPMSERAARAIVDAGVMPLATIRDTGTVRMLHFGSVASPSAPLAGRWQAANRTDRT